MLQLIYPSFYDPTPFFYIRNVCRPSSIFYLIYRIRVFFNNSSLLLISICSCTYDEFIIPCSIANFNNPSGFIFSKRSRDILLCAQLLSQFLSAKWILILQPCLPDRLEFLIPVQVFFGRVIYRDFFTAFTNMYLMYPSKNCKAYLCIQKQQAP